MQAKDHEAGPARRYFKVPSRRENALTLVIPDVLEEGCATRQALERLAAKWRVLLVYALLAGPQRHAELRRRLPGITQKVMTETLRGMEGDGLVERRVLKDSAPQHVEYALTALGKTLQEPLSAICAWAMERSPAGQASGGPGSR
jgi:DNA-binding HxlR family transcriptional regulator